MEVKVYLPSTNFSPTPVIVTYSPDTTTKEVVQDLSKKFQVQAEERTLIITPTSFTTGGVIDPQSCIKSINLGGEERLELWKTPFLINILLISDHTSPDPIKQRREIIFDYGSPLSYNIPMLRRIFNLDEEFVFQYIRSLDDEKNMVRLDSKKSLSDQAFEGSYWLLCTPVKLLKGKDGLSRCTETFKEGYLVKQSRKGNKQTAKRRRWAIVKDQFLFYFKNKGDATAAGVVPLEYYTISLVQIKQQPSLHLKRAIGRFDEGNADLYIMYAEDNDDLLKWKEVLQRKCLNSGIFGVTLHEMVTRPSKRPYIPDIVLLLTDYLVDRGLDEEGILRIAGSNAMVQIHKDQFDRGISVNLSVVQDVHVVASLLKMYFRELPDPAIPFTFYDEVIEIMNMRGPQKTNDVTPLALEAMSKLPEAHYHVVKHMCRFLFEVQKHSANNLMALPALGTVMGPNLLRPPDNRIGSFVQDSQLISEFIQILIKNHDLIRRGDSGLKTLPRPAPLRSSDESPKSYIGVSPPNSPPNPSTPARPKRPSKIHKARQSIFELKGALLMEAIPKHHNHVPTPPKPPPLLFFAQPNGTHSQPIATNTPQSLPQQILSKSPSKNLLLNLSSLPPTPSPAPSISPSSASANKRNSPSSSPFPSPSPSPHPTPRQAMLEITEEVAVVENTRELTRTDSEKGEKGEKDKEKGERERSESARAKGSATPIAGGGSGGGGGWNKGATSSTRPRLSTVIPQANMSAIRHATSSPNIADVITTIPVFDIDTVILYLNKLDETKYKKEKISLDSIKGGIKGEYNKEKELVRQIFCNQVAYILEVLDNQKSKSPSACWASLFYQRGQKVEDVLPTCKVTHYQFLLKNYLRIVRKKEAKEGQNPTSQARIKVADNFLDFLQTHATDPDSCLIGLNCSEESVKTVMRHVDPTATDSSNPLTVTYQQLCSMIVEWGVGEDDAWMKEQIQKLCTTFRGVDKMERGDVAIVAHGQVEDGEKKMIFGRFTGVKKQNNSHLEFYINAEESKTDWIFRREVYPLPANMKEAIKNKAHLSKVVQDPAHTFFKILKENMKMQTDEFLVKSGLDVATMKKVRDEGGNVELKDLPKVRAALNIVTQFQDNPPEHFYKEMTFYAKALVSIHTRKLATVPTFTFFMPRTGTINAMRNFANTPLAPSLIRTSLGLFQSAYDGLAVSVKEIMFGSKKRKMSDWWLERIELSVQHFLVKRRFEFTAIPENYSIEPPQSIKAVKENLAILEEILHAEPGSPLSPTPLCEAVAAEIYPVIDEFIKDARIVVCDALKLDINFEDSTFNTELVDESFKTSKDRFPQQTADQLKNLISDLKYLEEMKRLEKSKDGEKMAHIVPIGGLVMNQIVRQWNEHKTVMDIWGHLDKPAPPPEPAVFNSLPHPSIASSSSSSSHSHHSQTMKTSRSMDSLYLDPNTGILESSSKASHTPPDGSPLGSSTSTLAASIAASFFIKASNSDMQISHSYSSNAHSHAHAHAHAHGYSRETHGRDSPVPPREGKGDSPPANSKLSHSDPAQQHRTTSDLSEEMLHANTSSRNKGRTMNRNNSSIGMSTLRGVRRLLDGKEKDKEREGEREREREREREKVMQLHKVVSEQRIEDVHLLLTDPAVAREINTQDADGWTPLHCSCHVGNFEISLLILQQDNIDVTTKNKDGNTALHYIVRHPGGMEVITELLIKGANTNAPNTRLETPLHYACMRGHFHIVTFLLEHGADPNALNSDGENSLHYAIYTRSIEAIRLLLKYGANPEVCSKRQGTPLDIAVKNNFTDIAEELQNAPKKPARGEA